MSKVLPLLFAGLGLFAQDDAIPLWLRYPAISPDGSTVVFSYQGDLYAVPAEGGMASQLTIYEGYDTMPVWSHDGRKIAFASDRYGNRDVYVMPAQGGTAKRLTYHSSNDFPSDFSPDNQHVLFTSTRRDDVANIQFPSGRLPETYRVSVASGSVQMVSTIALDEPHYDRRGRRIVYQDLKGYEDNWRKHHTSSVTRDIWIYDTRDGSYTQVINRAGEDRSPIFSPDGNAIYYLSEENGTFNVYKMDASGGNRMQLTRFENHPVRFLTVSDNGTLCFTYHGEIYTMREGGSPEKLAVQMIREAGGRQIDRVAVNRGATEMAVSPSGKEVAFIFRGEVFVTSVESNTTKRVTHTPEQERSLSFHPEGRKLLFAGERDGSWNLYETAIARDEEKYFFNATLLNETTLLQTDAETFQPSYSPDGKEVAFLEDRTTLRVLNLESKEVRTVLPGTYNFSYADGDQYYQWSPDSKWFLVSFLQPNFWSGEVGLLAADGKSDPVNLTQSGYSDYAPKWMMGGKMVLWFSGRDGLQSHANTGADQADAYGMFFTRDAYDRFLLSKEEFELLKEQEKEAKKKKKEEEKDKKEEKKEEKKEDKAKPLEIVVDGIEDRKVRLTIHSSRLADAVITPDGEKLLYLARVEKGYDLWQTETRSKNTKILAKLGSRGGSLTLDKEGKHLFMLANGSISRIEIGSGKRKGIGFSGEMTLDRKAERAYLFEHAWRQVREKFYLTDLHGAKWDYLKESYSRYLPHIANNYDFADMLGELLGELNASHTGARYRHRDPNGDQTASLGLFYDQAHSGAGLKVAEVMPKSPVLKQGTEIKPGVIIEKIDGVVLTPGANLAPLLNRKAGKITLLSLHDPEGDKRWDETVKPISMGADFQLRYERWVESRRAKVIELSGGRIGYVHVRGMNDPSYRTVFEEVFGKHATKEALIVDTRFNGGGDLVEDLATFLSGKRYMEFVPPNGQVIGGEPTRKWSKPSAVLVSESNYSDAHCFPYAYQALGLGKVIGTPVPGTCTFVWWERLQDSSLVFGIPNMGVNIPGGRALENLQLEPDILVINQPGAMAQGEDEQLRAAVNELISQLDNP